MTELTNNRRLLSYQLNKQYDNVFAFSTTRQGGVSRGQYATFNCNDYSGDSPELVGQNKEILCDMLPVRPSLLVVPHQNHGISIKKIDANYLSQSVQIRQGLIEGVDALITQLPKVCICVSTADCIPILLYDPVHCAIAAVHSGWRGTVKKLVQLTINEMKQYYGTHPGDIQAVIGPGIGIDAFEVGDEVYDEFLRAEFPVERIAVRRDKWHINLWESNKWLLTEAGVNIDRIELSEICTYTQNENFFSARKQGVMSGRILNGIMILK